MDWVDSIAGRMDTFCKNMTKATGLIVSFHTTSCCSEYNN